MSMSKKPLSGEAGAAAKAGAGLFLVFPMRMSIALPCMTGSLPNRFCAA